MEENEYQEFYYVLKSSLKGKKYLGQEVKKIVLGDTMLVKSQTEDGKLCWIVENKKENIKPDYIEALKLYEEKYKKEQEDTRKNVIEYFKNSEMDSLSMLADIQYLVLNEMDDLRNKWLWKLYFNKIREELQSFHGTEQAEDEEEVDVTEGE